MSVSSLLGKVVGGHLVDTSEGLRLRPLLPHATRTAGERFKAITMKKAEAEIASRSVCVVDVTSFVRSSLALGVLIEKRQVFVRRCRRHLI